MVTAYDDSAVSAPDDDSAVSASDPPYSKNRNSFPADAAFPADADRVGAGGSQSVQPKEWLLLRGLGRENRHWYSFPRQLERALGAQCHLLDLPGMGSEHRRGTPTSIEGIADDLARRVASLRGDDPTPFGVLGISLGGMIAMCLCEYYPSWFSHLVLVNASSRLSAPLERLRPSAVLRLAKVVGIRDSSQREAAIYRLTTRMGHRRTREYAGVAASIFDSQPTSPKVLARQLLAATRFEVPEKILQKVLVLSSLGDQMVSPKCSSDLAHHLRAEHIQHPTAGHDLPLEETDWTVEKIRGWLESKPRTWPSKL